MSKPSYAECVAEGYECARERCIEYFGREPTEEELEEEYQFLCDKYKE